MLKTPRLLEITELWDSCHGKLWSGYGTISREISVLELIKLKGGGNLKSDVLVCVVLLCKDTMTLAVLRKN